MHNAEPNGTLTRRALEQANLMRSLNSLRSNILTDWILSGVCIQTEGKLDLISILLIGMERPLQNVFQIIFLSIFYQLCHFIA